MIGSSHEWALAALGRAFAARKFRSAPPVVLVEIGQIVVHIDLRQHTSLQLQQLQSLVAIYNIQLLVAGAGTANTLIGAAMSPLTGAFIVLSGVMLTVTTLPCPLFCCKKATRASLSARLPKAPALSYRTCGATGKIYVLQPVAYAPGAALLRFSCLSG